MVEGIYRNKTYFIFLSAIFLMTIVAAVITSLYWITIISFAFLFFYFGWQQAKYIFYLLIFSLPWSIEYNFSSSLGTDLPDELLMWFMTVLFFCWVIFKPTGLAEKLTAAPPSRESDRPSRDNWTGPLIRSDCGGKPPPRTRPDS